MEGSCKGRGWRCAAARFLPFPFLVLVPSFLTHTPPPSPRLAVLPLCAPFTPSLSRSPSRFLIYHAHPRLILLTYISPFLLPSSFLLPPTPSALPLPLSSLRLLPLCTESQSIPCRWCARTRSASSAQSRACAPPACGARATCPRCRGGDDRWQRWEASRRKDRLPQQQRQGGAARRIRASVHALSTPSAGGSPNGWS
ncbi:hypothetical protein DFH09DRAFT_227031 [Mycena vulgaris]|nr:hypothetical protein DFH09DRAFT_227031 [Mycena vulgaris]